MTDEPPNIGELEPGDTARVEYISRRSGNSVEREGEVAEAFSNQDGDPIVYVHDDSGGFFGNTYVALLYSETTEGDECVAAISISTEPMMPADDDPPEVGRTYAVTHSIARKQTLGVVTDVIRITDGSLTLNDVL